MGLLSNKIKGIFRVSFANLLSLAVSLLTSFLLPYFVSVEEYGYWQLFVLYSGYVGMFALGFNDGIHLNYAGEQYSESIQGKFHTFLRWLGATSIIETLVTIGAIALFFPSDNKKAVLILAALNIVPVLINGMFTYLNQSTLRFKQYSRGNIIDKVIFLVIMMVMLLLKRTNSIEYILAFTITRYIAIVYNIIASKEVVKVKAEKLSHLTPEMRSNYVEGIPLMVATLLNGTIITCGRLLVENRFGIEEFSAYSFSLHTLVVASQFISAIASVFYPIMKRCRADEFGKAFCAFDGFSSIFSAILLLSYYPAAIMVNLLYKNYISILSYLFIVYPLFIFQCKSNLLIINAYKVKKQPLKLVVCNSIAIALQLLFTNIFYFAFGTIRAVALATVLAYALWYLGCIVFLHRENTWKLRLNLLNDIVLIVLFIVLNTVVCNTVQNFYLQMLFSGIIYVVFIGVCYLIFKKQIHKTIQETKEILKD